jgi:lipopolysaccharide/colanic/teichoic acid biosynthesis glycosyltransferase
MSSLSPIPAPFEIARLRRGAALAPVPLATGLLRAGTHRVKRFCDVLLVALLAPPAALLGILIALAIRLDSPGPVFFRHTRAGKARLPFGLWKFRTMVEDAGARLEEHLRRNPECDREWALTHKLRNDPRVTRVGRFLRKTSLDELPQFWNVLQGDMSMVGPRPIVFEEIPKYGSGFALYAQVLPGVTGLWQVSGRNDTHYSRRVELDCHYVRAWNAALDFGILLRTVAVMIRGRGAY